MMQPPQQASPLVSTPDLKEKELTHDEMIDLIPKGINAISCPGGNCGHTTLKNKNKTKKWKECPNGNCGANTVPKDSEFCPYCEHKIKHPDEMDSGVELEEEEDED